MAIISVKLIGRGRGGSMDTGPTKRITDVYRVVTDDANDDSLTVLEAVDPTSGLAIPDRFDEHSSEINMRVESKHDRPNARNPKRHEVLVNYSTRVGTLPAAEDEAVEEIVDPEQDPVLDAPIVSMRSAVAIDSEKGGATGYWKKADGNWTAGRVMIANSAFEPYRDEFQGIVDTEMSVRMNSANVDESTVLAHIATWVNIVNTLTFLGWDEGQAKTLSVTGARKRRNGFVFMEYTYVVGFRNTTWYTEKLDAGTYKLDINGRGDSKKDQVPIVKEGQQVRVPIMLDGLGNVLTVEEEAVYSTSQTPFDSYAYRKFCKPDRGDLNLLPFMLRGVK